MFTSDIINDQCKSSVFDADSVGLGSNIYFAYGTFGIRMYPQWKTDYQSYVFVLIAGDNFIDTLLKI